MWDCISPRARTVELTILLLGNLVGTYVNKTERSEKNSSIRVVIERSLVPVYEYRLIEDAELVDFQEKNWRSQFLDI